MQTIAIFGVGRSSGYLLDYLAKKSAENNWKILACDRDEALLLEKTHGLPNTQAEVVSLDDQSAVLGIVRESDIVVSMLPPAMHMTLAALCVTEKKHLATASYVSKEMKALHKSASENGLVFLNEMGLDPGLDHMSAMRIMDGLRGKGAEIVSFESHTGGLISEEDCESNPWKYKFTWNPMNVVTAGQGGVSVFKESGKLRFIPWHQLFTEHWKIDIPSLGSFEAYANRDSMSYADIYGLQSAETLIRGTLRRKWFCSAWQYLVLAGYTDNQSVLPPSVNSMGDLTELLTGMDKNHSVTEYFQSKYNLPEDLAPHIDFLELQNTERLNTDNRTPAGMLLACLLEKWKLNPVDKDEVVMWHRIKYLLEGKTHIMTSLLHCTGMDSLHTAMAKTVGLPLALGVETILKGQVRDFGVQIPTTPFWYDIILPKLEKEDIRFVEDFDTHFST